MGSSGAFLDKGGFKEYNWAEVGKKYGIKILKRNNANNNSLPFLSNTPGTAYLKYHNDGTFSQFVEYGENRKKKNVLDYGVHRGIKSVHLHQYGEDGHLIKTTIIASHGSGIIDKTLYNRYKKLLKGIKL